MHHLQKLNAFLHAHDREETIPVFARWFGSWQISVQRRAMSASELTGHYDQAASRWSGMLDRLGVPDVYETILRRALSETSPGMNATRPRILDCGVGTGTLSSALARVSPSPFKLDGIDLSSRMLEQASRRLRGSGLEVSLCQGDARKLPYDDGVFDLAMTAHMLEHLVDPGSALREMVRVLKPGGLLIACLTRHSSLGMYVHLKWRTHLVTPAKAEGWLLASGLENAHCLSFDHDAFCRRLSVACVGRKPLSEFS